MKYFLTFILSLTFCSFAFSKEWCPQHEGQNPTAVVDVGQYKLFYFTEGSFYNESWQSAVVYLAKNNVTYAIDKTAQGISDWFSSTEFDGKLAGFSCDSVNLSFDEAWLIDENSTKLNFTQGNVRTTGSTDQDHLLKCL